MMKLNFFPSDAEVVWDDVITMPVFVDENGISEACEEGEENYWSVYLHQKSGGLTCVADLPTKELALGLEELLIKTVKHHVGTTA